MSFFSYLKDRFLFLLLNVLCFSVFLIPLLVFKSSIEFIILLGFVWFAPLITYMILQYLKFRRYFNELTTAFEHLDQKYLLAEVIKEPHFIEGKLIHELLQGSTRQMQEHVKYHKLVQHEYQEYIESWVHEIKTPISSISLIYENNQDSIPRHLMHEVSKVESYIDQVLYYARSQDVSRDYLVKKFNLELLAKTVIKKNAPDLIQKRIAVTIDAADDVYSDSKWVEFILNQIVGNAIKYSHTGGTISITSECLDHLVLLHICDSGIGIVNHDLARVFKKGFTGENGRKFSRSTGIGLYLCDRLCERLGLSISLDSTVNVGTTVTLAFPSGHHQLMKE